MTTIPQMKTKIAKLPINLDRMDGFVNGPSSGPGSEVEVDGGVRVKTISRLAVEAGAEAGTRVAVDGSNLDDSNAMPLKTAMRIVVSTLSDLKGLPLSVGPVFVEGRNAKGDGYGGMFEPLTSDQSTAVSGDTLQGVWVAPSGQNGSQGAWRRVYSGPLNIRWFDVDGTGLQNDVPAMRSALAVANGGRVDCSTVRALGIGETLILYDGFDLDGGNFACTLRALSSFSGDLIKSENWDALYGNNDAFAPGVLERGRLWGFIVDGLYQDAARTSYIRTSGHGVLLYVRKPQVKLRIYNIPGKGFHSYCPGGNGPAPLSPGYSRQFDGGLYVHQTKEEGIIWEGPPDVVAGAIFQTASGSRILSEDTSGKVSSPTYGAINGGQTDGIILTYGAEFSAIHAWGNYAGCGFVQYGGRIHCDLLISESNHFGGAKLLGGYGMISMMSVHRNGGFMDDDTPDFIHASGGSGNVGHSISNLVVHQVNPIAGRGIRDRVQLTASSRHLHIGNLRVSANSIPGHGLKIDNGAGQYNINGGTISHCLGNHRDGLPSAAVVRNTSAQGSIRLNVIQCDEVFRSGAAPTAEDIDITFNIPAGKVPFTGTVRENQGQKWDIRGVVGTQFKGTKVTLAFSFNSTSTSEQELALAHNLIAPPGYGKITSALVDIGARMTLSQNPRHMVIDYDATNIKVAFKVDIASASNSTPRVWLTAEV